MAAEHVDETKPLASQASEPPDDRSRVADAPPARGSVLDAARHPFVWIADVVRHFRTETNPHRQLTALYQAVGLIVLLITAVFGLGRFLLHPDAGTTVPNLVAVSRALAQTNEPDVASRAARRVELIVGELAALRRQEPALAGEIDAAFAALASGSTAEAEAVLRKKIAQSAGPRDAERRKRAEYQRYLAGVVFVRSKDNALRELDAAAQEDPESFEILHDLGDVALTVGDSGKAEQAFRESLRIAHASNDAARVTESLIGFGDALASRGNGAGALGAYQEAAKIAEGETRGDPASAQRALLLAISQIRVGDMLGSKVGDRNAALQALRRALALLQTASRAHADNKALQAELANCMGKIGELLRDKGERDEALQMYRDSLDIRRKLAAGNEDGPAQLDLALALRRTGDIFADRNDFARALADYREGLAVASRLAASDPSNTRWQREVRVSDLRVGDALRASGSPDEALAQYQSALALAQRLAARDPQNTVWQRDLALTYDRIADVRVDRHEWDAARDALERGMAIRKALADKDPTNTQWQRSIMVGLSKFGDLDKARGEREAAAKAYRDALSIGRALARHDPANVMWQSDLAEVLWDLADLGIDQRTNLQEIVDLLEPIEKSGLLSQAQRKFLPLAKQKLAALGAAP
jgi:tetratricopeptide (TPR) repeat protein